MTGSPTRLIVENAGEDGSLVIGKLLGHTVDQVKERNAEYDQQDMPDLVDEEVSAARARCS